MSMLPVQVTLTPACIQDPVSMRDTVSISEHVKSLFFAASVHYVNGGDILEIGIIIIDIFTGQR